MGNEEGSTSHAVYIQEEIQRVDRDPAAQYLHNLLQNIEDYKVKFSPIYMAPDILKEVNSCSFTPRVVSIGPLHRGGTNLKSIEGQKPIYLNKLLQKVRSIQDETLLDNCVQKVRGSIEEIKRCYFGMKKYTDDELVQMTQMNKYNYDELIEMSLTKMYNDDELIEMKEMKKYTDDELVQMTQMTIYNDDELAEMKEMKKYTDGEVVQMTRMKKYTEDELVQMKNLKKYTDDELLKMKRMKKYTDDELVQMMIMDAGFILQFIDNLASTNTNSFLEYNKLRIRNIALDLVLLENQIPYFVLQDIYDLTLKNLQRTPETPPLITMLGALLKHINPFQKPLISRTHGTSETTNPHHILGLLHEFYKPNVKLRLPIEEIPTAHSAVELDKVGVKIVPNENLAWPMAMEFKKSWWLLCKPTLKIPVVRIDNFFEVVFRNLIAYEQYSPVDNYVTSYAMAMHMLISNPADIAKLGKSGVINVSYIGSNENASDMISRICKNVNLQDFYYMEAWTNIAEYQKSYWPRNFGEFNRTY